MAVGATYNSYGLASFNSTPAFAHMFPAFSAKPAKRVRALPLPRSLCPSTVNSIRSLMVLRDRQSLYPSRSPTPAAFKPVQHLTAPSRAESLPPSRSCTPRSAEKGLCLEVFKKRFEKLKEEPSRRGLKESIELLGDVLSHAFRKEGEWIRLAAAIHDYTMKTRAIDLESRLHQQALQICHKSSDLYERSLTPPEMMMLLNSRGKEEKKAKYHDSSNALGI